MITNAERYESLGTNCELGFVLRAAGINSGGFFRWVEVPARSTVAILKSGLSGQYLYENLVPLYSNMVWDRVNSIGFHSKMSSKDKQWLQSDDDRRAAYEPEYARITFLIDRFRERLADPDAVFFLKEERGAADSVMAELAEVMTGLGAKRLLAIHKTDDETLAGRLVEHPGWTVGYVDRFAPPSNASDFSAMWETVMNTYDAAHPSGLSST